MEITKYDTVHTHSEHGSEVYLEEEIEKKPSSSSYDELESGRCWDEEEETLYIDLGFTHFDVGIFARTAKYDQRYVSKPKDKSMENLFKDDEALNGAFMAPMKVMSGNHSSKPCLNSNNPLEGHDNVFT